MIWRLCRLALVLPFVASLCASAQIQVVGDGGPGPAKAQHLTVQLTAASQHIAPGGSVQAGLSFHLDDQWHVYWKNAGDSGEPPAIKWSLPAGVMASGLQFPAPQRLPLGPLMDFGYNDAAVFPLTLHAAADAKPGKAHLGAAVSWLVCREVCIPGKANLGIDLNIAPGAPALAPSGELAAALKRLPLALPSKAAVTIHGGAKEFALDITGAGKMAAGYPQFYPFDDLTIADASDQRVEPIANGVRLHVARSPELTQLPAKLHGLIEIDKDTAYDVTSNVTPGEVPAASAQTGGSGLAGAISAIALAFAGGMLLNLMPCVFPVLFLKALALVRSSAEERLQQRRHAWVYTLGILASFWAIVVVLLLLRAGGREAGWGFQLQSPTFLAVLAAGLFFFSLSLAGQFDLGLSLTSVGGDLAQKSGYTGSFFTGVLATVVATPCTAPLMGAAIGFALAQPAWITMSIFTALALGLAAPYVVLSYQSQWVNLLPKPGAWMETLKQLTAVPLFATVIWLTWVYGHLFGAESIDRAARLLLCFLVLAIAGWALHRWPAQRAGSITALILAVVALAIPLYQPKDTTLTWTPYSKDAVTSARAAGHPVFIDFTAAWCLSCQVNERLVLKSQDVQKQFRDRKITLFKADWTRYDPAITQELASVNRSGVPTYVLYPANPSAPANVLPELLTKEVVLSALQKPGTGP